MLKKILLVAILIIAIFSLNNLVDAECSYDPNSKSSSDISESLKKCLEWEDSKLVKNKDNLEIEWWFRTQILNWVKNIAWFLGLVAVWALVYAAFMMTISGWEEEKVKKAKDMVKWTILWFLWVVTASSLIAITVNFIYSF